MIINEKKNDITRCVTMNNIVFNFSDKSEKKKIHVKQIVIWLVTKSLDSWIMFR